jgi:hypothetical protein
MKQLTLSKTTLETKDERGHGTECTISNNWSSDSLTLEIDYADHYNSSSASIDIDKERAIEIINFLQRFYKI